VLKSPNKRFKADKEAVMDKRGGWGGPAMPGKASPPIECW